MPEYESDNPIALFSFEWTTEDFTPRKVSYRTDLTPSLGVIGIRCDKGKVCSDNYKGVDGSIALGVIPARGALALPVMAALVRRRH